MIIQGTDRPSNHHRQDLSCSSTRDSLRIVHGLPWSRWSWWLARWMVGAEMVLSPHNNQFRLLWGSWEIQIDSTKSRQSRLWRRPRLLCLCPSGNSLDLLKTDQRIKKAKERTQSDLLSWLPKISYSSVPGRVPLTVVLLSVPLNRSIAINWWIEWQRCHRAYRFIGTNLGWDAFFPLSLCGCVCLGLRNRYAA